MCEISDDEFYSEEFSDEEDMSWKIRRLAFKVLSGFVGKIDQNLMLDFLVSRFSEKDPSVLNELVTCLTDFIPIVTDKKRLASVSFLPLLGKPNVLGLRVLKEICTYCPDFVFQDSYIEECIQGVTSMSKDIQEESLACIESAFHLNQCPNGHAILTCLLKERIQTKEALKAFAAAIRRTECLEIKDKCVQYVFDCFQATPIIPDSIQTATVLCAVFGWQKEMHEKIKLHIKSYPIECLDYFRVVVRQKIADIPLDWIIAASTESETRFSALNAIKESFIHLKNIQASNLNMFDDDTEQITKLSCEILFLMASDGVDVSRFENHLLSMATKSQNEFLSKLLKLIPDSFQKLVDRSVYAGPLSYEHTAKVIVSTFSPAELARIFSSLHEEIFVVIAGFLGLVSEFTEEQINAVYNLHTAQSEIALGKIATKSNLCLDLILRCTLLTSLKEFLISSKEYDAVKILNYFINLETDESTHSRIGECISMIISEKRDFEEILVELFSTNSILALNAVKFMKAESKWLHLVSDLLSSEFSVQKTAVKVLYAFLKKSDVRIPSLAVKILPLTFKRPELVKTIQMGPFKHEEDVGLPVRKTAYEMLNLIDVPQSELHDAVCRGLADLPPIQMVSMDLLQFIEPDEVIISALNAILSQKPKKSAMEQEIKLQVEIKTHCERILEELRKNECSRKRSFDS